MAYLASLVAVVLIVIGLCGCGGGGGGFSRATTPSLSDRSKCLNYELHHPSDPTPASSAGVPAGSC
jgi:hypothetical protein